MLQGEPSVFDSETARDGMAEPTGRRSTRQVAGTDYPHAETCQVRCHLDLCFRFAESPFCRCTAQNQLSAGWHIQLLAAAAFPGTQHQLAAICQVCAVVRVKAVVDQCALKVCLAGSCA